MESPPVVEASTAPPNSNRSSGIENHRSTTNSYSWETERSLFPTEESHFYAVVDGQRFRTLYPARSFPLNPVPSEQFEFDAIIFDLDDTLYEEKTAKVKAEIHIAELLAPHLGGVASALWAIRQIKREVAIEIPDDPSRNLRRVWFWHLLKKHGIEGGKDRAQELEDLYWATMVEVIRPYGDVKLVLSLLADRFPLWIASNEHTDFSCQKLENLGLSSFFAGIITADAVGHEKPDRRFYESVIEQVGAPAERLLFIGDDPLNDILGAKRTGMKTVRFRRGPNTHLETDDEDAKADFTIDYLTDLLDFVMPTVRSI